MLKKRKFFLSKIKRRKKIFSYKRRNRQKKIHLQSFFTSRLKKYTYYFKKNILHRNIKLNLSKLNCVTPFFVQFRIQKTKIIFIEQLLALLKFLQRYVRMHYCEYFLKHRINFFPDFYLTAKPKATRMGRGKGQIGKKICFLKKGQIMFEFRIRSRWLKRKKKKLLHSLIFIYLDLVLWKLKSKLTTPIYLGYNVW